MMIAFCSEKKKIWERTTGPVRRILKVFLVGGGALQ